MRCKMREQPLYRQFFQLSIFDTVIKVAQFLRTRNLYGHLTSHQAVYFLKTFLSYYIK